MDTGLLSLIYLAVMVVLIILFTGKWKVNAFFVLLAVAFAYGGLIGMPLKDIIAGVKAGFGGTLSSIGIVIIAGTIMGSFWKKPAPPWS